MQRALFNGIAILAVLLMFVSYGLCGCGGNIVTPPPKPPPIDRQVNNTNEQGKVSFFSDGLKEDITIKVTDKSYGNPLQGIRTIFLAVDGDYLLVVHDPLANYIPDYLSNTARQGNNVERQADGVLGLALHSVSIYEGLRELVTDPPDLKEFELHGVIIKLTFLVDVNDFIAVLGVGSGIISIFAPDPTGAVDVLLNVVKFAGEYAIKSLISKLVGEKEFLMTIYFIPGLLDIVWTEIHLLSEPANEWALQFLDTFEDETVGELPGTWNVSNQCPPHTDLFIHKAGKDSQGLDLGKSIALKDTIGGNCGAIFGRSFVKDYTGKLIVEWSQRHDTLDDGLSVTFNGDIGPYGAFAVCMKGNDPNHPDHRGWILLSSKDLDSGQELDYKVYEWVPNIWYRFRVEIDVPSQTFNFYLDCELLMADVPFRHGPQNVIGGISISTGGIAYSSGDTKRWFDNFKEFDCVE